MKQPLRIVTIPFLAFFCIQSSAIYAQLTYTITTDTIASTEQINFAGECKVDVANNSDSPILLTILRQENQLPNGWYTTICDWEQCHFDGVDSVSIQVPPQSVNEVKINFAYLSHNSDTARCLMLFRNEDNVLNSFQHNFYGVDGSQPLSVEDRDKEKRVQIGPNPFDASTRIQFPETLRNERMNIISSSGVLVRSILVSGDSFELQRETLSKGVYLLQFESGKYKTERLVIK